MSFDTSALVAYVNGEYVPLAEASVSIFDHGFLYGDGVFEGMRVFEGGLFRAGDHMARRARTARSRGIAQPVETP
jgi:branched-chain amino acid aminotransferase